MAGVDRHRLRRAARPRPRPGRQGQHARVVLAARYGDVLDVDAVCERVGGTSFVVGVRGARRRAGLLRRAHHVRPGRPGRSAGAGAGRPAGGLAPASSVPGTAPAPRASIASRSWPSHSSACWPTSRTHQASASDAAAGHPARDQRVEHQPLRLAQPGHHRHRQAGEHLPGAAGQRAPGHLAAVAVLGLAGHRDPLLAGLSRNRVIRPASAAATAAASPSTRPGARQPADDEHLVAVDRDLGRALNQSSGSRPANQPSRLGRAATSCRRPARPPDRGPRPNRRTAPLVPVLSCLVPSSCMLLT